MSKLQVTLGIDVGGTNTVFGLVDKIGQCFYREKIPTNATEPAEKLFERLFEHFNQTIKNLNDYEILGVGVGAPNANYYTGMVEQAPNLNWGNVNLVELVKKYFDIPVAITNDANAAALGEMLFGNAKGMKNFIEITLGTGLGSGVVVDGKLVYGHDGFAGEFGHTTIKKKGRMCGCGRQGCLEAYVSASGIVRSAFELLLESNADSVLRKIAYNDLTSKIICDAAKAGDEIAIQTYEYTGRLLGEALTNAVALLSPEAIIFFGGITNAGELLFNPIKEHMERNMLNIFKNKVKILPSGLPEGDAAILGASALIWNELRDVKN